MDTAWMIEPVFWNWLIIAVVFFLLEAIATSFFFIFLAIDSLIIATITVFMPELSWQWQFMLFALLSLPTMLFWYVIARRWQSKGDDLASKLNNRAKYLIGRQYVLKTPIEQNYGRLQIDDTLWTIYGEDMPAGTKITITSIDSSTLNVSRID